MKYYTIVYAVKRNNYQSLNFSYHIQTIDNSKPFFVSSGCEVFNNATQFKDSITKWIEDYNKAMFEGTAIDFNFHCIAM